MSAPALQSYAGKYVPSIAHFILQVRGQAGPRVGSCCRGPGLGLVNLRLHGRKGRACVCQERPEMHGCRFGPVLRHSSRRSNLQVRAHACFLPQASARANGFEHKLKHPRALKEDVSHCSCVCAWPGTYRPLLGGCALVARALGTWIAAAAAYMPTDHAVRSSPLNIQISILVRFNILI